MDQTLAKVQTMTNEQVLGELKKQGIGSLDALVSATMKDLKGGDVSTDVVRTFIYSHFVYHEET